MSGIFSVAADCRAGNAVLATVLALGASMATEVRADEPAPCRPEAWEQAIEAFEKQDDKEPPPKDGIVFVGSSSIRLWDLKKSFPDMPTINRGFGGSNLCDAAHFAERLVVKYSPRLVVLYAGDNDIGAGKSPTQVYGDFREFVAKVHKPLPETEVVFISIKPSIARWKYADKIREANKLIAADCEQDKKLKFIDVWPIMLGADGQPRPELFRDDHLHMNETGYEGWTKLVRPLLELNHEDTKGTEKK